MNRVLDDGSIRLDWTGMKEAGFVVVDTTARKMAAYSNASLQVVIASHEDGIDSVATLELHEVTGFLQRVLEATQRAKHDSAIFDASYEAHQACQRAMR